MVEKFYAERIFLGGEWKNNRTVIVTDGVITKIQRGKKSDRVFSHIVPSFLDVHIHGGQGFGITCPSVDEMKKWLVRMAKQGVGGVVSCPYGSFEEIRNALSITKQVMEDQKNGICGGATLIGVHLEGPYISPNRPGAMTPGTIVKPDVEAYKKLVEGYEDMIRLVSIAPEDDEGFELTKYLVSQGVCVQAGHTDCDYETALKAFEAGVDSTCHTFNAMRPIKHRDPAMVTAALTDKNVYCEVICDLVHIHPGVIKLIYQSKGRDRMMLISDAIYTTGMPDGIYEVDGWKINVQNGESRLLGEDTLDGGGCFTSESVKRLVNVGLPLEDCLVMASATPAKRIKMDDWQIQVGKKAQLACWKDGKAAMSVIGKEVVEV